MIYIGSTNNAGMFDPLHTIMWGLYTRVQIHISINSLTFHTATPEEVKALPMSIQSPSSHTHGCPEMDELKTYHELRNAIGGVPCLTFSYSRYCVIHPRPPPVRLRESCGGCPNSDSRFWTSHFVNDQFLRGFKVSKLCQMSSIAPIGVYIVSQSFDDIITWKSRYNGSQKSEEGKLFFHDSEAIRNMVRYVQHKLFYWRSPEVPI